MMLLKQDSGPCRGLPRALDSPTMARVQRAMLRHQEIVLHEDSECSSNHTQSLVSGSSSIATSITGIGEYSIADAGGGSSSAIKRGLLWQQRAKLFSRWKERYFILTKDYLHCFRRASGTDHRRITEMGQYLFKIKLVDVDRVEWENRRTYSVVVLILLRDGKIYLRAPQGLEEWFELLDECTAACKERRRTLKHLPTTNDRNTNVRDLAAGWKHNTTQLADHSLHCQNRSHEQHYTRHRIPDPDNLSISTSISTGNHQRNHYDIIRKRDWRTRDDDWDHAGLVDNRLSLLTDIDLGSLGDDGSTLGTPSLASYRISQDVVCVQRNALRPLTTRQDNSRDHLSPPPQTSLGQTAKNSPSNRGKQPPDVLGPNSYIKFRERSSSDIQSMDHRLWSRHFE